MMWKMLTVQIREKIYYLLISWELFPEEQKRCRKVTRAIREQCIDQHIPNESKIRRKNEAMAWIDNEKTFEMVPQNWIIDSLKM